VYSVLRWRLRWPTPFIASFLALQLLLPLDYYFWRIDRHDERWAWRMFSPIRMVTCSVEFRVDGQPVTLGRDFHVAWIQTAQRGRRMVVEEMGQKLCRQNPGTSVVARLECTPLASIVDRPPPPRGVSRAAWYRGEPYHMGGFNLCEIPDL
jgi:hypothetical protein